MKRVVLLVALLASSASGQDFWRQTAGPGAGEIVSFGAGANGRIFAASHSHLNVTTDFGKSWSTNSQQFTILTAYALSRDTSGFLYLADADNIYRSSDNGTSWSATSAGASG